MQPSPNDARRLNKSRSHSKSNPPTTMRHKHNPLFSMMAFALAASSGLGASPQVITAGHSATVTASRSAQLSLTRVHRQAPIGLRGSLYRASGLFKHSSLNQRQRRKLNRQRFAAGDKKAFA